MLTRIKAAEILPVGISEVKAHLRLDHAHEDEYLIALIQSAAGFVEEYLGRSLLTQVWRLVWEKEKPYPPQLSTGLGDISSAQLAYPPFRTIISVNRLLPNGSKQPIRRHCLELNHQIPRLVFAESHEPVEIVYEAGYGEKPTDIPPAIRHAILMFVADFYEHRESESQGPNAIARDMLDTYRIVRLA